MLFRVDVFEVGEGAQQGFVGRQLVSLLLRSVSAMLCGQNSVSVGDGGDDARD